jgi:hypothetical protein
MSKIAHQLKRGEFFYDEHDHQVYEVRDKKEIHGKSVHLDVQNFVSNHRTTRKYSHDHNLVVIEPERHNYDLSHLVDLTEGKQYLCLIDAHGEVREDLFVDNKSVINDLIGYVEKLGDKVLVHVTKVHMNKLHRDLHDFDHEKITGIKGIDMSHMYDHHHHDHHDHHGRRHSHS